MDISLLPARIDDLCLQCTKTSAPKFLGFLTPSEAAVALAVLKNRERYSFFGGYDGAERTCVCVMPDWCDEAVFPITAITITYRKSDSLSHRDFLGALMALGIARETIGDILVESGRAVVFVLGEIADFVITQITKIGSVGVALQKGMTPPLPNASAVLACSDTVASLRLDCVIASICNFSRAAAVEVIADGLVAVNSVALTKATSSVREGDVITVRKKGRFKITACDEYSKKGRIILKYDKYI